MPDPPGVLTSNAGWDTVTHQDFLTDVVGQFKAAGIRTSLFLETDDELVHAAKATGTDRIELYTEAYAVNFALDKEAAVAPYVRTAKLARTLGLGINAGHDLNLDNLSYFAQCLHGYLDEVSIGHALISDALYLGLHNTIQHYLRQLDPTQWK